MPRPLHRNFDLPYPADFMAQQDERRGESLDAIDLDQISSVLNVLSCRLHRDLGERLGKGYGILELDAAARSGDPVAKLGAALYEAWCAAYAARNLMEEEEDN